MMKMNGETLDNSAKTLEKPFYGSADRWFAIAFFALGYLFVRWCLYVGTGFCMTLFTLAVLLCGAVYFICSGIRPKLFHILGTVFIAVMSLGFCISTQPIVVFFDFMLCALGFIYISYDMCGNRIGRAFGKYFFFDIIKCVFVIPFSSFSSIWGALFSKSRTDDGKKSILGKAMLGLLISVIPLIIVVVLLKEADAAFSALLGKIFSFSTEKIIVNIIYLIIGILPAMYIFGAVRGNAIGCKRDSMTPEDNDAASERAHIVSVVTSSAAVIPLLIVYMIFFVSQSAYFLNAFSGILPSEYSYADYARSGFFELCEVSVINMIVIAFLNAFTKRTLGRKTVLQRVLTSLISVSGIILCSIDIAKMFMYIGEYGLSVKRVVTSWFMLLLGMIFLLILLKQLFDRLKFAPCAVSVCVLMVALLVFCNVDALVARYNVNAYLDNRLEKIDIEMISELDDSAVEYVVPLLSCDDEEVRAKADKYFVRKSCSAGSTPFLRSYFGTYRAERVLCENGYLD